MRTRNSLIYCEFLIFLRLLFCCCCRLMEDGRNWCSLWQMRKWHKDILALLPQKNFSHLKQLSFSLLHVSNVSGAWTRLCRQGPFLFLDAGRRIREKMRLFCNFFRRQLLAFPFSVIVISIFCVRWILPFCQKKTEIEILIPN